MRKKNKNAGQRVSITDADGLTVEKYIPDYGRPHYEGRHKGGFSFIISAQYFNRVKKEAAKAAKQALAAIS